MLSSLSSLVQSVTIKAFRPVIAKEGRERFLMVLPNLNFLATEPLFKPLPDPRRMKRKIVSDTAGITIIGVKFLEEKALTTVGVATYANI